MVEKRFVILTQHRTGSTWLVSLLNSHPEIRCHGELFRQPPATTPRLALELSPKFHEIEYRNKQYQEYLEAIFALYPNPRVRGFKLMPHQHSKATRDLLKNRDWKVIHLARGNELAVYASNLTARVTGQGYARHNDKIEDCRPVFDADDYASFIQHRHRRWGRTDKLLDHAKSLLQVEYSELADPETQTRILDFLGVDPSVELNSNLVKRGHEDILSRFANPDDVRAYLETIGKPEWAFEEQKERAAPEKSRELGS